MFIFVRNLTSALFLAVLILPGCELDSAKEQTQQELVIASDFLNKKDESLFKEFNTESGVRVRIIYMSADSLVKRLNSTGYASGIDMVVLRSALDMCIVDQLGYLQVIHDANSRPDIPKRYRDGNSHWYGIAIDPYIILSGSQDSLKRIRNYRDLGRLGEWMSNLKSNDDWKAFNSGLLHKMKKDEDSVKSTWLKTVFNKQVNFRKISDSSIYVPPLFTKYSKYYSDSSLFRSAYRKTRLIFPNQTEGGTFYELRAAGIIRQASNYTNAVEFLRYITQSDINQRINSWWNTFPITSEMERSFAYQNVRFKYYPAPMNRLCEMNRETERMFRSVKKK